MLNTVIVCLLRFKAWIPLFSTKWIFSSIAVIIRYAVDYLTQAGFRHLNLTLASTSGFSKIVNKAFLVENDHCAID